MPAARLFRHVPVALNLLRALALASATLLSAPTMAALTPDVPLAPRSGSAWWTPFADPVLDGLVARAAGSDTTQRAIVQGYVGVRTLQARLGLVERLLQAAAKERELTEQSESGARGAILPVLAARAAEARRLQQTLNAELERQQLTLAALSRGELQRLQATLAEGAGNLPQVGWAVPFSLRAAAQAQSSVLPALQAASAQVKLAGELVQASELELRASQLRQRAGADSTLSVLAAYQRLLADADRLASTQGALALAWAELLQGLSAEELPRLAAQLGVRGTDPAPRAP